MPYLILENGRIFEGSFAGTECSCKAEIVFNTSMVGYLEILTDKSNAGKIVVQTFPMIGNYGTIKEDIDGACTPAGYIAREIAAEPSNFRCDQTLGEYLEGAGIPALCGIDTRELTRIIRKEGSMKAIICKELPERLDFDFTPEENLCEKVSTKEKYTIPASKEKKCRIAVLDLGLKKSFADELAQRGAELTVFPHNASAEQILADSPDALFITHGPSDPNTEHEKIAEISKLCGCLPIFAVGLGNQLLALCRGGASEKHKYGHRGANHPVKFKGNGRTYISEQNHGFYISTLPTNATVSFINENDGTPEGIDYTDISAFGVDFYPDGKNFSFLFDRLIEMTDEKNR